MKITAKEFQDRTEKDPNWCSTITESTEVIDFLDLYDSKIQSLSSLLIFSGRNEEGNVANFIDCKDLNFAEGTFHGYVSFNQSGISRTRNLTITQPNNEGRAASFWLCKNLSIAEGIYPGYVNYYATGIKEIKDLEVTQPNKQGLAINFKGCPHLKKIRGKFKGSVNGEEEVIMEYHQYLASKKAQKKKSQEPTLEL